jgi:predicted porin
MTINLKMMAAGLIATVPLAVMPAGASDLGGNCCADLEERIAELEQTTARKGNRKVSVTVSGHVNQAIVFHDSDDAAAPDTPQIISNSNSSSRFRFKGSAKINDEWSAGFMIEIAVNHSGVTPVNSGLTIRHEALYLSGKSFGMIWVGNTSDARDGIVEIDLAGASTASTLLSLAPDDQVFGAPGLSPFDGGRSSLVKYTTHSIAGFTLSASWSNGDTWDAALRYAGEFGGVQVAFGIGYGNQEQTTGNKQVEGSLSILHAPSGLFVNAAAGDIDFGVAGSLRAYHGQAGIAKKVNGLGKTIFGGGYAMVEGGGFANEPNMIEGFLVQHIDAAAMEIYARVRRYDLDGVGGDDQLITGLVGIKIKF